MEETDLSWVWKGWQDLAAQRQESWIETAVIVEEPL